MKCLKCNYDNNDTTKHCTNCGALLNQKMNKRKNILLFTIFSIIYSFTSFLFIFFGALTISINEKNIVLAIIQFIIGFLLFFFGIEFLTTITTKAISKSKDYLKESLFVFDTIIIIITTIVIFLIDYSKYVLIIILILFRFLSWFITRKIVIKDKISLNKKVICLSLTYIVLIFFISNLLAPTPINKSLFKLFGNTSFSSKDTQIMMIEEYNTSDGMNSLVDRISKGKRRYSYFHKLSQKELNQITILEVSKEFNEKDILKLKNLESIEIRKNTKTDNKLDFANFKKLRFITINTPSVKYVELPDTIETFDCKSKLDYLDISRFEDNVKNKFLFNAKTLVVNSINQLGMNMKFNYLEINDMETYENKLFGLDDKTIFIYKSSSYDNFYSLNIPEYTKISEFKLNNLKMKAFIDGEEKPLDEVIVVFANRIMIKLYDNNDKLFAEFEARAY